MRAPPPPTALPVLGAVLIPLFLSAGFATEIAMLTTAGLVAAFALIRAIARTRRPSLRWIALALATTAPAFARALESSHDRWPYPPLSRIVLMAGIAFALISFVGFARSLSRAARQSGIVDSAVLAAAGALLLWIFVIAPAVNDQSVSGGATFGIVTYAVLETALIAALGTFAFGLARHTASERLLIGAGTSILLGGALGDSLALHHQTSFSRLLDAGWLLALVLIAAAALSSSSETAVETRAAPGLAGRRLAVLALSLLAAPTSLVVERYSGQPISVTPLVLGAFVVTGLVCVQVVAIARSHESLRLSAENSRRRFRELSERLRPVVIECELGADTPSFVSLSVEAVFGYPRESWLESSEFWVSRIDAKDRERVIAAHEAALGAEEDSFVLEYRMRTADDHTIWVRHHSRLRSDSVSGRKVYSTILDDVSERKLDREELERSLALLRATLDVTADGILVVDDRGVIAGFNRRFVEMWNIPESALAGNGGGDALAYVLDQLVDPTGFLAGMEEPEAEAEAESLDVVEFKDGRRFQRYSRPQRTGETIVGRVWSFRDVTVRVRAEEALRDSERSFRETLENMRLLAVALDANGAVTFCNDHLLTVTGYPREELLGQRWFPLALPEDRGAEERFVAALAEGSFESHTETVIRTKAGENRTISWSATLLHDPRGARSGIVAIGEDVTGARAAETALRQNQEQLYQAQKMEAVGRLAGGVAHDFNNLLTAISGYSEFLISQLPDDGVLRHDAEEIQRAAERAAGLTRQLLAFGRRQVLRPEVIEVNSVVAEMEDLLRRLIGEDVELATISYPGQTSVIADRGQLEQVLVNLAVNARDAMPRGGRLTVETASESLISELPGAEGPIRPGRYVTLTVSDTGEGIPEALQSHLFEPFFTTRDGLSTGLGLATVYGIVKQSDGEITVASGPGSGSIFRIYLPCAGERHENGRELSGDRPQTASETILLVEDEGMVRTLIRSILERQGYLVLEASDGPSAIELSRSFADPIDLLLTDIVMPQMSGYELAERLSELRPGLRVLFASGYTDDSAVRADLGDFIRKPFLPKDLLARVGESLATRPERSPAP